MSLFSGREMRFLQARVRATPAEPGTAPEVGQRFQPIRLALDRQDACPTTKFTG